jgi:hypothetical protein
MDQEESVTGEGAGVEAKAETTFIRRLLLNSHVKRGFTRTD